jgi:hypothetical protein
MTKGKAVNKIRKQTLTVAFIMGILLLAVIAYPYLNRLAKLAVWQAPGWEIYNAVSGVKQNGTILSNASQFASYSDTVPDLSGNYWSFDLSPEHASNNGHTNLDYGVPTISVSLGDIRHVDFSGQEIPDDQPARAPLVVTIGSSIYYLDYHIYTYTVTVRTFADTRLIYSEGWGIGAVDHFAHETSWPWEGQNWLGGGYGTTWVGTAFSGGIYTAFNIQPWTGLGSLRSPPNASYDITGEWAGIMNSYVISITEGQVANQWGKSPTADAQAEPNVRVGLTENTEMPVFVNDGSFANPVSPVTWDASLAPTTRVNSSVVQYLPIPTLQAGAYLHAGEVCVDDVQPCDVAVQYTIRTDVLMTENFTLHTAINPPNPSWPSDYFSWAKGFWASLLGGLDPFAMFGAFEPFVWFIFTLFVIGIVALVLLAIFAPWAIPRVFGSFRGGYDALKGKKTRHNG